MKTIFSIACLLFITHHANSQIAMIDTVVYYNFPKDKVSHLLADTITNNSPNTDTISWNYASDTLQTGMTGIAICDPGTCFPYGPLAGNSFIIAPGSSYVIDIEMKADTSAADGESYVTISTNYGDMVFKFITLTPLASCSAGFYMFEDTLAAPHTYIGVNTCTGNNLTYDWSWGDGTPNSSGPFPTHTYAAAGVYNICVAISDTLGCTDTFCSNENINKTLSSWYTITFSAPTAVNDQQIINLSVYPNPVKDVLHINGESKQKYKMDIYSIIGAKVQSKDVTGNDAINVSDLPAGIYLLKVSDPHFGYQYIKLQKE